MEHIHTQSNPQSERLTPMLTQPEILFPTQTVKQTDADTTRQTERLTTETGVLAHKHNCTQIGCNAAPSQMTVAGAAGPALHCLVHL